MKVAQLTTWSHPNVGGVELHVKRLSEELRRIGIQAEIFSFNHDPYNGTNLLSHVKIPRLPYGLGVIPLPQSLKRILETDADIVHCHAYGYSVTWMALLARILRNKPVVCTTHGDPYSRVYGAWDLGRSIPPRRADRVIALTEQEAGRLTRTGVDPAKIRIIPNGVDLPEKGLRPIPEPYILCVGRVEFRHKGQDMLIEAYKKMPIDHKLVFIGTGPDLQRLQELARSMDNVEVLGFVNDAEKNAWMSNADLMVVPSRTEAYGIVALEAMLLQRRLIVTRVGGLQHITDGYALIADPNPESLARTILEGLNPARPPGSAQLNPPLSWSRVAEETGHVYTELA